MITAKLGNNIINCYDKKYDKDILKKWSAKNIIICPVCGKPYEYCHGKIISPYFRHKDKQECLHKYYESETEEHIKGKIALYEWVRTLDGVTDVILEGWIPETKQRPDVMFRYNGKQYVIEYQCTPIASEFLERSELYQAVGIIDIWILGLDNYNLEKHRGYIWHKTRLRTIEKYSNFYLDYRNSKVYVESRIFKCLLHLRELTLSAYYEFNLCDFTITRTNNKSFLPKQSSLKTFVEMDNKKVDEIKQTKSLYIKYSKIASWVINKLKIEFKDEYSFEYTGIKYGKCLGCIDVYDIKNSNSSKMIFYIYQNKCEYNNFQNGYYSDTLLIKLDENNLEIYISNILSNLLLARKNRIEQDRLVLESRYKLRELFSEYLDSPILFLQTSKEKIDYGFKFKFLNSFYATDFYMKNSFINELSFFKSIGVSNYVFMIPNYHPRFRHWRYYKGFSRSEARKEVINYMNSIGFTNVKFYDKDVDSF